MAAEGREGPEWGVEREGAGVSKGGGDEFEAACAKPEEREGRDAEEVVLCADGRDAGADGEGERQADEEGVGVEEVEMLMEAKMELSEEQVKQRFAEALRAAGSIRRMAAAVGVSYGLIGDVARGRREVSGKLAEYLKVEVLRTYREVA